MINLMKPADFDKDSTKTVASQAKQVDDNDDNDEVSLIRKPTKILDFLYLGSQEDALSEPTMKVCLHFHRESFIKFENLNFFFKFYF